MYLKIAPGIQLLHSVLTHDPTDTNGGRESNIPQLK